MRIPYATLFFSISVVLAVGIIFFKQQRQDEHKKLFVVCTTSMITDAVKKIGGDLIDVYGLMGPGVDPHLYRATEGDAHHLASADIIFYNGLHLEGKMGTMFAAMHTYTTTIAIADALEIDQYIASQDMHALYDPHIWFDVALWMRVVTLIRDTLVAHDHDEVHQKNYYQRAESFLHELSMLHSYVQARAQELPKEKRILITAHDAFSYFGRAYDFDVIGLQGISTDAEISTKDIQDLVEIIINQKIPAIFVESSVPYRSLQAVQDAVAAHGWHVVLADELFSDALDSPNTQSGTYIGMVRHNIDTIVNALQGGV